MITKVLVAYLVRIAIAVLVTAVVIQPRVLAGDRSFSASNRQSPSYGTAEGVVST